MLDVFITSRVRRKIVVVYAKYPDTIQRELRRLEKVGFLHAEKQGNTRIYSNNKQFPIFKELQSIVIKSQQHANSNRPKRTTSEISR